MPEEMIDSAETESAIADSPDVATDVSEDAGSNAIAEDSPIEEQQVVHEESAPDTQPAQIVETKESHASVNYERDYKALQGEFTRTRQEYKQLQKQLDEYRSKVEQYKGVDPTVLQQFQQKQSMPVWHPQNDKYQQFMAAQERMKVINGLPEMSTEQKQAIASQHLSEDEMNWLIDWGKHQRQEQQRMAQDPTGYIQSQVKQYVQEAIGQSFNQYTSSQHAQQQVHGIFTSPEFRQLYLTEDGNSLSEYGQRLNEMMGDGIPYERADQLLRAEHKLSKLEAENIELRQKTATAAERDRILRDGATDARELRVGGGDIEQEAKRIATERGIGIGTSAYLDILIELESQSV